jgi:hypothetical protein
MGVDPDEEVGTVVYRVQGQARAQIRQLATGRHEKCHAMDMASWDKDVDPRNASEEGVNCPAGVDQHNGPAQYKLFPLDPLQVTATATLAMLDTDQGPWITCTSNTFCKIM